MLHILYAISWWKLIVACSLRENSTCFHCQCLMTMLIGTNNARCRCHGHSFGLIWHGRGQTVFRPKQQKCALWQQNRGAQIISRLINLHNCGCRIEGNQCMRHVRFRKIPRLMQVLTGFLYFQEICPTIVLQAMILGKLGKHWLEYRIYLQVWRGTAQKPCWFCYSYLF